jgi:hypothetical protein
MLYPYGLNMANQKLSISFYFIMLILFVHGCSPCSNEEVTRSKSPDRRVEVVHVRGNCGATTSYSENIFIVPIGDKTPKSKDGNQAFLADHVDGLNLVWREPRVLEIHYKEARIFNFTNFWHSKKVQNFSYVVEIRLIPSKTDFSLSKIDRWLKIV